MEVLQTDDRRRGKLYIEENRKILAEMTYVWAGNDKIIIDHTEVDDVLRGQGAGKKLVLKSVEFARANHLKIVPLCPFAKSVFDKEREIYLDVL